MFFKLVAMRVAEIDQNDIGRQGFELRRNAAPFGEQSNVSEAGIAQPFFDHSAARRTFIDNRDSQAPTLSMLQRNID